MKLFLLSIITSFVFFAGNAQSHKTFFNKKRQKCDSAKAVFYIISNKVSDTAWVVSQYEMDNTLDLMSTYKDETLGVPHGAFAIYEKDSAKGIHVTGGDLYSIIDTTNHITTTGSYFNGTRSGTWINYFKNGDIEFINTYQNDALNGPYEGYNYDTNTPFIKGNYLNDKREGPWYMLDTHGNVIETDTYQNGDIIKKDTTPSPYVGSVPPDGFKKYVDQSLGNLIPIDTKEITIAFTVSVEGKLVNPQIIAGTLGKKNDDKLLTLLISSPLWTPAYDKALKKNMEDIGEISIRNDKGELIIKCFDQTDIKEIKSKYYQINH